MTDLECSDNDLCTGIETCAAGQCVAGTPVVCNDDGISCTKEFCASATGQCEVVLQDALCDDQTYCNGVEKCSLTGCQDGVPVVCADSFACTTESCDEASKSCKFVPDDSACTDGLYCNGEEKCDAAFGCVSGEPPLCMDDIPCTDDSCDESAKACAYVPNDGKCADSFFCNGVEKCDVTAKACVPGPLACTTDNIACTNDCDEVAKACTYTPDHTKCEAGKFCVPLQNGCVTGTLCGSDADCSDGLYCNGEEKCASGTCQPGVAVVCADIFNCTLDSCDEANDTCAHVPMDSVCDNAMFCDGADKCDVNAGCVAVENSIPNCDDGKACTTDACSEAQKQCVHTPDDTACTDFKFCNGSEQCDPSNPLANATTGCVAGPPAQCPDDGIACTSASCDPVLDKCVTVGDDSKCTVCGESCVVGVGCTKGACVVTACQGHVYECGDCLDNDGDCKIDSKDSMCMGPCDNTEDGLWGGIPGQNSAPCKQECYFDGDTGGGNDNCYWNHKCDPFEQGTPPYPEEKCKYDASMVGSSDCPNNQSQTCLNICGPLVPNGCDCFGCCEIVPGSNQWIWLGSITYANGDQECTLAELNNPAKCHPCTPTTGCLNTCAHCELCFGKTELPDDCTTQECPTGRNPCGQPDQPACPTKEYCISGCCQPTLQ